MAKNLHYKRGQNRSFSLCNFYSKNRKGLSTVVITVLLISLSMIAMILVWTFVSGFIKTQIKGSESCFGNYDKIQLNGLYTCYENPATGIYNLRFSLTVGDVDVEKVVVSVSSSDAVKSYEITNINKTIDGLFMYPSGDANIRLPGKNAGLTYNATGFISTIDSIQIMPVIGGNTCEVSDSTEEIADCALAT